MINTIENFYQYSESLASGAQPTIDQLIDLKDNGFDVIVNLSPASARNALHNEAEIVEKLGLDYIHFPVDCSKLRPEIYTTFEAIMNGLAGRKRFIHCGGNIKSSNLIHMYQVLKNEKDETESLKELYKIQQPEEKWFEYFRKMGLKGLK